MAKDRKSKKPPHRHPRDGSDSAPSRPTGGGFVFTDRSGKVRTIGGAKPEANVGKNPGIPRPDDARLRGYAQPAQQEERGAKPYKHKGRDFQRDDRPRRDDRPKHEHRSRRDDRPRREERPSPPSKRSAPRTEPTKGRDGFIRLKGVIDKNRKGFAFLIFDDSRYEDLFLPPQTADGYFHGDRVEVTLGPNDDVREFKVLEHRFRELVGRWQHGFVVYERKKAREEVFVPQPPQGVKERDWVRVKLSYPDSAEGRIEGIVQQVYGQELPASADLGMVAAEFNLIEEHSEAAKKEAEAFRLDIDEVLKDRTDLRHVPFITIDGETARDFDDAVYVEREGQNFILWVGIADVSHYVKPGTAIDDEAYARATSVYFPEKAFHMLPRALSENLCSLRPNEPRLSFVARMTILPSGQIQETQLFEALIHSRRRATYTEIQAESEANAKNPSWEYAPHFELYWILRKARNARGSVDFDLPEAELKVEPTGEVISIKNRGRQDAHRLIEEFMIAANEAVTEWALERKWPFIYRVHEEPSMEALKRFSELARMMGFTPKFRIGEELSRDLNSLVLKLDGHPAQFMLNMALLRSMKQAVYSAAHGGHFGLASKGYTHFTSPIRRYPDLLVHRMLRQALRVEQGKIPRPSPQELKDQDRYLEEAAEHCSHRERLASNAERESIRLKQVRAMIPHLGDEFDGRIIGMLESGMFIQIDDPWVEGMLPQEALTDDFYSFQEQRMTFIGRRSRKQYRIGDTIRVKCVRVSLDDRQIDFGLPGAELMTEEEAAQRSSQKQRDGARRGPKSFQGQRDHTGGGKPKRGNRSRGRR